MIRSERLDVGCLMEEQDLRYLSKFPINDCHQFAIKNVLMINIKSSNVKNLAPTKRSQNSQFNRKSDQQTEKPCLFSSIRPANATVRSPAAVEIPNRREFRTIVGAPLAYKCELRKQSLCRVRGDLSGIHRLPDAIPCSRTVWRAPRGPPEFLFLLNGTVSLADGMRTSQPTFIRIF